MEDSHAWTLTDVKTKLLDRVSEVQPGVHVIYKSDPFDLCDNEWVFSVIIRQATKESPPLVGVFLDPTDHQPFQSEAAEIWVNQSTIVKWQKELMPGNGYGRLDVFTIPKLTEIANTKNQLEISVLLSTQAQLKNEMKPFSLDAKFSDVTLKTIDSKDIQAHKVILANRSPVFLAMFSHEMKESKESVVNVQQTEGVMLGLLEFIYKGVFQPTNIKSMNDALALFDAAMFYDLGELASKVNPFMKMKLTSATVLSALKVAGQYRPHKAAVALFELTHTWVKNNLRDFLGVL